MPPSPGAAEISAVKVWTNPDYTRLVLHLTAPTGYRDALHRASSDQPDRPAELSIDLREAALGAAFEKTLTPAGDALQVPVRGGLLEGVRLEHRKEGGLRLVLSVVRLRNHRVTLFTEPNRILIDLFGEVAPPDERDDLEALVLSLPGADKGKGASANRFTVVIDAGHGGDDPGAMGPGGTLEKDITLAMALQVQKKLSTLPGVRVIMTRETDEFISLDERTAIANGSKADLFISIHCNASPVAAFHGIETYYLDTASDEAAAKLASRENASIGRGGSDLAFILQDLVIEGNVRYSRRLAQAVHESMLTNVRKAYPPKSVKDLGVKTALFYVLFGAQMPSILVETAFISNEIEEKRLKTAAYHNQVAASITAGVKRYTMDSRVLSRVDEQK